MLFQGYTETEQLFNVNKDMLVENLEEKSLTGQRIVFNHMSCTVIEIQDFDKWSYIPIFIVKCPKYMAALEEKWKIKVKWQKQ